MPLVLDVAETDGAAHGVAEHAGGETAHELAVPPDRLAVIEHAARVLEREGDEPPLDAGFLLAQQRLAPDEIPLPERDGEAEAGFERRIFLGDVVAPVPVGLLDPERVERVVAGVAEAEAFAGRDDRVVDRGREFRGHIELPAELAHIGDAGRAHARIAEVDLARRAEEKGRIREILVREARQQRPRARSHEAQHGIARGDVHRRRARLIGDVPLEPGEIAGLARGAGDDEIAVVALARHREVGLDAAALVQPLGIDHPARRHRHVVGTDPVEDPLGVRALQQVLGEGGLVEEPDRLAHRLVLGGAVLEPILAAVAIAVLGRGARGRKPVGALPARELAEAGAALREPVVQRRFPDTACALHLAEGPVHVVEQAQRLDRALAEVAAVALEGHGAANIHVPEVHGRMPVEDPVRQHLAGATR